jgi:hypothetical protein
MLPLTLPLLLAACGAGDPETMVNADEPDPLQSVTLDMVTTRCAQTPGHATTLSTVAETRGAVTGRWALCTPTGLFGLQGEAGMVLDASGRYASLAWSGAMLARQDARESVGTFQVLADQGGGRPTIALYFISDAGLSTTTAPIVTDAPRGLQFKIAGVEYRYVALP